VNWTVSVATRTAWMMTSTGTWKSTRRAIIFLPALKSQYLLDAGSPFQRWVSAEDNLVSPLDNVLVFTASRAVFITRTGPLPAYKMAAPWSP
jgi:hypothetical protein